jgi:ABC-type Mn2+/Zn2+ transport system permease subunit
MVEWLIEPLAYSFFQRGLVGGLLAAIACGVLSGFIVWRGMAFIGDALSHSILPGIVLSYAIGTNLLLGAILSSMVAVAGIGFITRKNGLKEDTAIGVIFSGFFALGILLLSKISSYQDLTHILFGNILGISSSDVVIIGGIVVLVIAAVFLFYKELLVTSFDPVHAVSIGLAPMLIHYGLLVIIALTTVVSIQSVGVVLILALLVTPAASASMLVRDLPGIIGLGTLFAVLSCIGGFYISYYFDAASGPAIVIVLSVIFMVCFAWNHFSRKR